MDKNVKNKLKKKIANKAEKAELQGDKKISNSSGSSAQTAKKTTAAVQSAGKAAKPKKIPAKISLIDPPEQNPKEDKKPKKVVKPQQVKEKKKHPKPPKAKKVKDPQKTVNAGIVKKPKKKRQKNSPGEGPSKTYIFDRFYEDLSFTKKLNSRKFLVLDLDPDKVRYVLGRRSGSEVQVSSWGVQKFPADEKDHRKALQIALENIRSKVYSRGIDVSIGIFNPEINIRQVSLPKMQKEADLKNAIDLKNQSDLQNYNENSIWSYEIIDKFIKEGTKYYTVLVTYAPADVIEYYTAIFDNLKIELKKIFPRPAAIQSAYQKMVFRPGRDLLINIAYDLTQMCFIKNGNLNFIRNVSIGSRNLEVSIHTADDKVSVNKEEKNDKQLSSENPSLLRNRLLNKINDLKNKQNPVLHTFFSEILRSMAFIQGRDVKQYIERIFVTGYGIRKESLIPYLRTRLNLPIFILTPQFKDTDRRTLEYGEFFTTIGSSLQDKKSFNLLPKRYFIRKTFKKLNYFAAFFIVILTLSLGYISVEQNNIIHIKKSSISQYEKEYTALNPFEGMYNDVQRQIAEVNQKSSELQDYVKTRPPIINLLRFFSNETPKTIHLEEIKFLKLADLEKLGKTDNETLGKNYKYQIEISGVIDTDPLMGNVTLINYINHIIDLKFFKRVELLNNLKDADKNITKFQARMFI